MRPHAVTRITRSLGALAIAAVLQAGCAASHNVARDLTLTNQPDSFEMHVGVLENFTHKFTYDWPITGTKATVRQASSFTNGVGLLQIKDASGLVVHDKNLREVGTFITLEGKPGVWKIKVTLEEATGSLTFLTRKSG
jgi:hypothetical protein